MRVFTELYLISAQKEQEKIVPVYENTWFR